MSDKSDVQSAESAPRLPDAALSFCQRIEDYHAQIPFRRSSVTIVARERSATAVLRLLLPPSTSPAKPWFSTAFVTIVAWERFVTAVCRLPLSLSTSPATTMKRRGLLDWEIQSLASHEAFVPANVILLIPHPHRPPRNPLRHFLPYPCPLCFRHPRPTSLLSSALSSAAIGSTSNRGSAALSSASKTTRSNFPLEQSMRWVTLLEAKQALGYPLETFDRFSDDNPYPSCDWTRARHVRIGHSRQLFLGQYVFKLALVEYFLQRYPKESSGPMRERVYALIGKWYLLKWIKAASLRNLVFPFDEIDKLRRKESNISVSCQPRLRRQLEDVDYVSVEFEGKQLSWQDVINLVGRINILSSFSHASWSPAAILPAIPRTVLTLGFHVITPFICKILGRAVFEARKAIIFGVSSSALPAILGCTFTALPTSFICYAISFPKQLVDTLDLIFRMAGAQQVKVSLLDLFSMRFELVEFGVYSGSGKGIPLLET
ncbi:RNA-binding protein that suppresses calcineurin Rnc1 [Asimina triloba]